MEYSNIKVDVSGKNHVGMIVISREEASNSIDDDTALEIICAMEQLKREEIRSIIITGEGEKYFSAGADLKKMQHKTSMDILKSKLQDLCTYIENYPLPVIAAVNGYALGGGMELALACDFRVATPNAVFGFPETSIGLIPSAGGTERITSIFGIAFAKRIIMLGEKFDANKALNTGFVEKISEHSELMNTTLQLAAKLERKSTFALMAAKICINSYVSQSEMHKKLERMSQAMLVNQVDVKEGIGAFFEKRYPQYSNSLSEYEGVKNEKSL